MGKKNLLKKLIGGATAALMMMATVPMQNIGINLFDTPITASAAVTNSIESGTEMQYISSISTSGGTTVLSNCNRGNLNRGLGSKAADYFLYVNFTSNADEAITGLIIDTRPNLKYLNGWNVTMASANVNTKGTSTYIYYTKDKSAGDPIASIGVWQDKDNYFEYVTNNGTGLNEYYTKNSYIMNNNHYCRVGGTHEDLNKGAGSKSAYVYLYYKRAPYVKVYNPGVVDLEKTINAMYNGEYIATSSGTSRTFTSLEAFKPAYNMYFTVNKPCMLPISSYVHFSDWGLYGRTMFFDLEDYNKTLPITIDDNSPIPSFSISL